jgi:hypothetical protein
MKTILNYAGIVIKAIARFVNFPYAAEVSLAVVAVLIGIFYHRWMGGLLFIWAALLFINAYKPVVKQINIPPQV